MWWYYHMAIFPLVNRHRPLPLAFEPLCYSRTALQLVSWNYILYSLFFVYSDTRFSSVNALNYTICSRCQFPGRLGDPKGFSQSPSKNQSNLYLENGSLDRPSPWQRPSCPPVVYLLCLIFLTQWARLLTFRGKLTDSFLSCLEPRMIENKPVCPAMTVCHEGRAK